MKTAIITGASSGLGKEYALQLKANFPEVEQVWLIARRKRFWMSWARSWI